MINIISTIMINIISTIMINIICIILPYFFGPCSWKLAKPMQMQQLKRREVATLRVAALHLCTWMRLSPNFFSSALRSRFFLAQVSSNCTLACTT